ncbi:MAG: ubiquitin carboxyl-terminal hydrolase family protein, partial [Bacteroidota bacterium]
INAAYYEGGTLKEHLSDIRCTFISEMISGINIKCKGCKVCNKATSSVNHICSLLLPITCLSNKENSTTLEKNLESYFMKKNLEPIVCENCRSAQTTMQELKFVFTPTLLIIVLEKGVKGSYSLNPTLVDFPMELQNENLPDRTYDLISVVNYIGATTESGHYTACVKSVDDQWYKMDDDQVSKTNPKAIVTRQARILFYRAREKKHMSLQHNSNQTISTSL